MITSKNAYELRLQADCEVWLKNNYYNLHKESYSNFPLYPSTAKVTDVTNWSQPEQLAAMQLTVATGPWKSLYVHFKEPGDSLSMVEKVLIDHLRDEGHRVSLSGILKTLKLPLICIWHSDR